ncbi:hypothetical protein C8Q79DRAFT_436694 [Trametes meyenii]|nr:hypothetical protein C8Q79DRAFT_436694 [Trametes meyenii]
MGVRGEVNVAIEYTKSGLRGHLDGRRMRGQTCHRVGTNSSGVEYARRLDQTLSLCPCQCHGRV